MHAFPRRLPALTLVLACGAPAPPVNRVTVVPAPADLVPLAKAEPLADPTTILLVHSFDERVTAEVRGIALEGGKLFVNVAGSLQVFDAHGPVATAASAWKLGDPLVAVGTDAFDPLSFTPHAPPTAQRLKCEGHAFSYGATRMSVNCWDAAGEPVVYVYDTRSAAQVGVYREFRAAAPVRSGEITSSGNFIFWTARAVGAFEEIKSHVTGPTMSSRSVMSRDESMLFTTVDRRWYVDDETPAKVIDPKNAHELFQLGQDVDMVFFSPSSRLLAARHSKNWADPNHAAQHDETWLTIHGRSSSHLAMLAPLDADEVVSAAFAPDDSALAVLFASGLVSVYSIRP